MGRARKPDNSPPPLNAIAPSFPMSVKSDWHCQPGSRSCRKYTSLSPPPRARQRRTFLCSVRNWSGWNRPGYGFCNCSKTTFACSAPPSSSIASTSSQTFANGSSRVRQYRGSTISLGSFPRCRQRPAVRSLMPAFAAAVASGLIRPSSFINTLICRSVINALALPKEGRVWPPTARRNRTFELRSAGHSGCRRPRPARGPESGWPGRSGGAATSTCWRAR